MSEHSVSAGRKLMDVLVEFDGSVARFELKTQEAKNWVNENVELEGWQWLGKESFAVDHRFTDPLITGMEESGLSVEVL